MRFILLSVAILTTISCSNAQSYKDREERRSITRGVLAISEASEHIEMVSDIVDYYPPDTTNKHQSSLFPKERYEEIFDSNIFKFMDPFNPGNTYYYYTDAASWFILQSPGPDGKVINMDLILDVLFDPEIDKSEKCRNAKLLLLSNTFDPANGTNSAGDVYATSPNIGFTKEMIESIYFK